MAALNAIFPMLIGPDVRYARVARFLTVFNAVICTFKPVLVSVPGAIPIFITVSVTFGVKLRDHGTDYTSTCELKSLDRITNQAASNLARTCDKDRCSRHT